MARNRSEKVVLTLCARAHAYANALEGVYMGRGGDLVRTWSRIPPLRREAVNALWPVAQVGWELGRIRHIRETYAAHPSGPMPDGARHYVRVFETGQETSPDVWDDYWCNIPSDLKGALLTYVPAGLSDAEVRQWRVNYIKEHYAA